MSDSKHPLLTNLSTMFGQLVSVLNVVNCWRGQRPGDTDQKQRKKLAKGSADYDRHSSVVCRAKWHDADLTVKELWNRVRCEAVKAPEIVRVFKFECDHKISWNAVETASGYDQ